MSNDELIPDEPIRSDMVDRLMDEGLLPLAEALKKAKVRVSIWTGLRWVKDGIRNGLVLEGTKCGGRWMTSVPAVKRFVAAQARQDQKPEPRAEEPSQQASQEEARKYLEALGFTR